VFGHGNNKCYLREHLLKKKGVMGLDPIPADVSLSERQAELEERKKNGRDIRIQNETENGGSNSNRQLNSLKLKTANYKISVARRSGVKAGNDIRNYKHLFDAENLYVWGLSDTMNRGWDKKKVG